MRNAQWGRPRFGDSDFGATRAQIVAGSFVLFVPFAIIALLLCLMFDIEGWARISIVVTFGSLSARACVRMGLGFANLAGQFVARFVAPSGSTTV